MAKLRPLALVAAAAVCGAGTTAHADLVGKWFSGPESLNDSSGHGTPGTHNAVAIGANAHLLSYNADVPAGFTGKSLDLKIGNVGVMIANSATTDAGYVNTFDNGIQDQMTVTFWAKGFPSNWAGWVSKRGEDGIGWQVRRFDNSPVPCFTIRGLDNEDGSGGTINVNENPAKWHHYAAVWDKSTGTRYMYVDGVLSNSNTTTSEKPSMTMAPTKHLGIGARQTGGTDFDSYFLGLLYDVRVYNAPLTSTEVMFMVPPKTPTALSATPGNTKAGLTWTGSYGAASYTITTRHGGTNALQTNVIQAVEGITNYSFTKTNGLVNGQQYFVKISATNPAGVSVDSAEISVTPTNLGSSAKDILTFDFDYLGPATISGTNIIKNVPVGTDLTYLVTNYTISPISQGDVSAPSGAGRDFTTPKTYTITAENGTTKTYTVTVIESAPLTYDFNTGAQGWSQIWPLITDGTIATNSRLNAGGDLDETRFARSPVFYLNNLGPLTFDLMGGQSLLAAPGFGPSAIPQLSQEGGFAGAALRDVASNTYVLSKSRTGNGDAQQSNGFSPAELAPFANNGRQYTLDYIDYNKGGWGWTNMDNVSIPGTLAPVAEMISMSYMGPAAMSGDNITLTLPFGSSVTALAPTFTLSPGATSNKASGSTQNFTNPVTYTVTSSDTLLTRTYTVTAVVLPDPASALVGHWVSGAANLADSSGFTAAGTHDGVAVGSNAGALAFNPNDVPRDFGGSSLDLRAGNVAVQISNTATTDGATYANTFDQGIRSQMTVALWAKGFPGEWNPWVSKGGEDGIGWQVRRFGGNPNATFTIRGVDNEDGPGSIILINQNPPVWHHYAAVWDQASGTRSLYVDGVLSHDTYNTMGQLMALAPLKHLFLGGRQGANNVDIGNYFQGLLYDVRIYKQKLFPAQVVTVMTTPTTPQVAEAKLRDFGLPGNPAVINGTEVTWTMPIGTDLSALAPTFTLTAGAVSNPVSGVTRNFNTPQTYTVTGSDSSVNVYTVNVVLGNNFNTDNTLDGWHNRVWDGTASAWVDLAPNVTEMPANINGGITLPEGLGSLFRTGFGAVEATETGEGGRDNHMNTLWLRSPQFVVGGGGDLTLKLAKGTSHTGIAPANEAAVPFAAVLDGGWMGVILRRVSDGAFVLTKAKSTGNDDTYRTYTFTQAELTPFVGVACTIELINADKGSWGWVAMDDVVLPKGSSTPAVVGTPFDAWIATNYPGLSDKTAGGDPDGDGLSNQQEYAFGLNPSSGSSVSPIVEQLNKTAGTFRYTRRDPTVSGLNYTVLTSTNLVGWTPDTGATASQTVVGTTGDVQTVAVTLTGAPLGAPALFVRVKAQ